MKRRARFTTAADPHPPSRREEVASTLTHAAGVVFALVALGLLTYAAFRYGELVHKISFPVFGLTMLLVYLSSTIYHAVRSTAAKGILRIIDHAAIYFLIAGTYTPFSLIVIGGADGWWIFGIEWALAAIGITAKVLLRHTEHIAKRIVSTALYLFMGWLIVFRFDAVLGSMSRPALLWLLGGGIFYTVGVIFFAAKKMKYSHAVWHLFVVGGSVSHFVAVYVYLLPA